MSSYSCVDVIHIYCRPLIVPFLPAFSRCFKNLANVYAKIFQNVSTIKLFLIYSCLHHIQTWIIRYSSARLSIFAMIYKWKKWKRMPTHTHTVATVMISLSAMSMCSKRKMFHLTKLIEAMAFKPNAILRIWTGFLFTRICNSWAGGWMVITMICGSACQYTSTPAEVYLHNSDDL